VPAGATVSQVSGASVNGAWFTGNAENRPVRWHQGQVEELGLAFGRPTALVDVNSAGVAVGYIPEGTGVFDAIVYRNGQYEYLPEPAGMSRSRANSVNNAGDIVGVAVDDNSVAHAVLWPAFDSTNVIVLEPGTEYSSSRAEAIDDQSRVLITASTKSHHDDALVWSPTGKITRLPTFTPDANAQPNSLRNGRAVGSTFDTVASDYATLVWDVTGQDKPVRINAVAPEWFIDSSGLVVGIVNGDISFWRDGILVESLKDVSASSLAGLTDTGVLAGNKWKEGSHAVTYHRVC
jgi:uncharacterized membrane protein